ncbi:MAG: RDD family protein [Clostridia bacterium]|nr:RDD family protein [Clostridia bacterium]
MENNETLNTPVEQVEEALAKEEVVQQEPQPAPVKEPVKEEPKVIVESKPAYVNAGMAQRIVAFIIDSALAALIAWIIRMPVGIMNILNVMDTNKAILFNYSINDSLFYVVVAAYFILFTIFLYATPGKMLMHIKVVALDDKNEVIDIIFRETIGRFLSSILLIGYIIGFFDADRRCLHDRLGDTRVVANVK